MLKTENRSSECRKHNLLKAARTARERTRYAYTLHRYISSCTISKSIPKHVGYALALINPDEKHQ